MSEVIASKAVASEIVASGVVASEVIAVVGATGSGKSALADALALALDGEVISADSMQVYRGMDIGTAKLPAGERSVPYHCIDLVNPDVFYTAALYQRDARAAIKDIRARGRIPVMCGGTGLYLRAALDDFVFDKSRAGGGRRENLENLDNHDNHENDFENNRANHELRAELTAQAEAMGKGAFHALLAKRDPASAALIHPNNLRRVIRAFELLAANTTYAQQQAGFSSYKAFYSTCYLGIEVSPAVLYEVIDRRVDALLEAGLLGEAHGLVAAGYKDAPGFSQAIGYKELLGVITGSGDLKTAAEQIKQATRRYAKRQRTWFGRDNRIRWIDATDLHKERLAGTLAAEEFTRILLARTLATLEQQLRA